VLEQLISAAQRKWVHLCLTHRIEWPSFIRGTAILPSAHSLGLGASWAWLAPISVADLPIPGRSHNHTCKFPYSYHMRLNYSTHTLHYGSMTLYIYTHMNDGFSLCFPSQSPGRPAGPDPSCQEQYYTYILRCSVQQNYLCSSHHSEVI
jgi:hypothetical protein